MGVENYKDQLLQLLPRGKAWSEANEGLFGKLLHAIADELNRVDTRAKNILDEADPRTTYEMLPDWERVCGLPDECSSLAATVEERRQCVVARLIMQGGQSIAFLIQLAASIGYDIDIEEFFPFCAGDPANDRCFDDEWAHVFACMAPETTIRYLRATSGCAGERLAEWGDDVYECVMSRAKPAHSTIIFAYEG